MIGVIVNPEQPRRGNGELPAYASPYIGEILRHAGIPFTLLPPQALTDGPLTAPLIVLAQDLDLSPEQQEGAAEYVRRGGNLVGIAGASGMDELFGVRTDGLLQEGYLQPPRAPHPITGALGRETHVFGGSRVTAIKGTALARVAPLQPPPQSEGAVLDAIVANLAGRGRTLLFAPDVVASVLHIHQGKTVVPLPPRESAGAPSASILDPDRDGDLIQIDDIDDLYYSGAESDEHGRTQYNRRVLLAPMADVLRELLLRAIFHLLSSAGETLPVLWYWPRGLASIAHMSHDSDGNRVNLGWTLFDLLQELGVPSTWCTMPVPGYRREFYDTLIQSTSEIALHYATGNAPLREDHRWSQMDFDWQYDALCYETGLTDIVSNKNHGLAWQGRLEFYHWCQAKGIQIEQSRGDRGFTFGTSHPWLPMEDDRPGGEFIDVLALCFLSQDFTVVCPHGFMRPLVDQCHAAYGVAHALYHPSHLEDPECERSIREAVAYARSLGMEWWTSEEINTWERARRRVAIASRNGGSLQTESTYTIDAGDTLKEATLLFLLPQNGNAPSEILLDGNRKQANIVERYGHLFAQVTADLGGEGEISLPTG